MANDDVYKIRVTVDPAGATTGLSEVAAGERMVKRAAEETADAAEEGGEKLDLAALGNIRSVHHLLAGLMEMREGGVAALGGIAAEGRVATEVFEGMLGPLAPIALTITTIAMLAAPMVEKMMEGKDATEAHKKAEDDLKDSVKDVADEIDDAAKKETDSLKAIQDAQKIIDDNFQKMVKAGESSVAAANKLIELQKTYTQEVLKSQEEQALAQAKTPQEQVAIKKRFDDLRGYTDDVAAEKQNNLDQTAAYSRANELGGQFQTKQDARDKAQTDLDQQQKGADTAIAAANAAGLKPDAKTGRYNDALTKASGDLKDLQAGYQDKVSAATELYGQSGSQSDTDQLNKAIEGLDEEIKAAQARVNTAQGADAAVAGKGNRDALQKQVDDASKDMDELRAQEKAQDDKIEQLRIQEATRIQKSKNDAAERNSKAEQDQQKDADLQLSDATKAAIRPLEDTSKDKTKSVADRQAAVNKIAELTVAELQNKLKEGTTPGAEKLLGPGEIADLQSQIDEAKRGATEKSAGIAGEQQKKDDAAARKAKADVVRNDRTQVDQLKAGAQAGGDPAMIAAVKSIVTRDKDNVPQELADLMQLHIQKQTAFNATATTAIQQLRRAHNDHAAKTDGAIQSLSNP